MDVLNKENMGKKIIKPEVIESKSAYENKYMTIKEEKVLFKRYDNEKLKSLEKIYYILEGGDFVVGIAIKDKKVLIVNQYRLPVNSFCNEFVAGVYEPGLTSEECMKKEFEEEAGIKVNEIKHIGEIYPLVGKCSFSGQIFLTTDFEELDKPKLEEFEQFTNLTHDWVPIEKFEKMIADNKIKCGVTIAAWGLAKDKV